MSISTNEPLLTKKLCPNLLMSVVPQTDKAGIYRGELRSIWIRTSSPLGEEQTQRLAEGGVHLTQPNPAYSQGASFVYTADLQPGGNLTLLLALRTVLQVRASERLAPSGPLSLSVPGLPSNQRE